MNQISKFTLVSGGAVLLATVVLSAPAQAALLDFSLTPDPIGFFRIVSDVSFTLNTDTKSISNEKLELNTGTSLSAPTPGYDYFYIGQKADNTVLSISFSQCFANAPFCGRQDRESISGSLEFSGLNLFNQLSSDPNVYLSSFLPGVGVPGGIFQGSTLTASTYPIESVTVAVTSLSVTTTKAVPEPTASISIVAFGAWGAGLLLKRRIKRP